MSFQQGLSGLNAASKNLETIGNNVANANTVGFKGSQAQFADVFASSLTGAGSSQIGIGTKLSQVSQQFTQGNVTATNNPLDIAINGGGFFMLSSNGATTYSRNGQFQLDDQGHIVNSTGARLQGRIANLQGAIPPGATPQDLRIRTTDLSPNATTVVNASMNLDSRMTQPLSPNFDINDPASYNSSSAVNVYDSLGNSHVLQTYFVKGPPPALPATGGVWNVYAAADGVPLGAVAAAPASNTGGDVVAPGAPATTGTIAAGTFSINGTAIGEITAGVDPDTQAANVAAAINAALGGTPATVTGGILTIENAGTMEIRINGTASSQAVADANQASLMSLTGLSAAQVGTQAVAPQMLGTLRFNTDGTINSAATVPAPPALFQAMIPVPTISGAEEILPVGINFEGSNQFGAPFSVNALRQDGYASGRLSGFNIANDGTIVGRYTNGMSATLGRVVLANFTNPNGLQPLGNNLWSPTSAAGEAMIGDPSTGTLGSLQASAVEDSNVDLTAELVNMITAQRIYQANAQTIKTQDQVLQTLVNLR